MTIKMSVNISLEDLVKAGAHFGHQTRRWNPKMGEYIHGEQEGIHVINLLKTKEELELALAFLTQSVRDGKNILLVGTKKQAKDLVEQTAKEAGIYYVNERWLGGTLTNFSQIKVSVKKLGDLKSDLAKGVYSDYTKKEKVLLEREIARLERFFAGIVGLPAAPDVLIIIDTKKEFAVVREARTKKVPTIGLVDTNSDPTIIDYAIPMNDDATKALEYVLGLFKEAILEGRKAHEKAAANSEKEEAKKAKKQETKEVKNDKKDS